MGLWTALSVGRSALDAAQMGLEVTGHNIANAATAGYARQRAIQQANPAYEGAGGVIVGTGTSVVAVQSLVDRHLAARLRTATSELADLNTRALHLGRLEQMLNEVSDQGLMAAFNEFFNALQNLEANPSDAALRAVFVMRAEGLCSTFNRLSAQLTQMWNDVDQRVVVAVDSINRKAAEIAALNLRIIQQEAGSGGQANDLRDQRAVLLEDLASLVEIRTVEGASGEINVMIGNDLLVQRDRVNALATSRLPGATAQAGLTAAEGAGGRPVFAADGKPVTLTGGELAGLVAVRDQVLTGALADLDLLAATFIREVNRVHASGLGLEAYSSVTAEVAVTDAGAVLSEAGLAFPPTHGHFTITVTRSGTGLQTASVITVDLDGLGSDATLSDIAAAIDAVDGVSASVDAMNRLVIRADSEGLEFTVSGDTSGLLAALGINTLFSGTDSRTMAVSAAVAADVSRVAASLTGEPGDGDNLATILALRSTRLEALDGLSLMDYLATTASALAVQSASMRDIAQSAEVFRSALVAEREAYSGVSLDEEALALLRYERSFQAAARFIAKVDELLQLLMSL